MKINILEEDQVMRMAKTSSMERTNPSLYRLLPQVDRIQTVTIDKCLSEKQCLNPLKMIDVIQKCQGQQNNKWEDGEIKQCKSSYFY